MKWKVLLSALCVFSLVHASQSQNARNIFEDYYSAATSSARNKAIKKIVDSRIAFSAVIDELGKGRNYSADKKRGFIKIDQQGRNLPPTALVFVPYDYTPQKKYQVMVYLHGAISNLDPDFIYHHFVDTLNASYKKTQTIYIYPSAWLWAPWWSKTQYENIQRLLSIVKKDYNVDENLIRLGGISDGGTGSYYLANCNATLWSSVTPFIGSVEVLNHLKIRSTFVRNYQHLPFYIVNSGKDAIFPKEKQIPYLKLMKAINPFSNYIIIDSAGHSMNWFPLLCDSISDFVNRNLRNPFPERISWSTDSDRENNRCFYVLINKLGNKKPDKMPDWYNEIEVNGKKTLAHARDSIYGSVEAEVLNNVVKVKTENIKRYTLLISPSQFRMDQPIVVWTDGIKSFDGIVTPNVATLLKWNNTDQDRTMLFAAELPITIRR